MLKNRCYYSNYSTILIWLMGPKTGIQAYTGIYAGHGEAHCTRNNVLFFKSEDL